MCTMWKTQSPNSDVTLNTTFVTVLPALLPAGVSFGGELGAVQQHQVRRYTGITVAGWVYPRVPKGAIRNRLIISHLYRKEKE